MRFQLATSFLTGSPPTEVDGWEFEYRGVFGRLERGVEGPDGVVQVAPGIVGLAPIVLGEIGV